MVRKLGVYVLARVLCGCSAQNTAVEEEPEKTEITEDVTTGPYLGEIAIGSATAKDQVTKKLCPTCPDSFMWNAYPELQPFVENGTIRLRFIPGMQSNSGAVFAPFVIARCLGQTKAVDFLSSVYDQEQTYTSAAMQRLPTKDILKEKATGLGLTSEAFDACWTDESLLKNSVAEIDEPQFRSSVANALFLNDEEFSGRWDDLLNKLPTSN